MSYIESLLNVEIPGFDELRADRSPEARLVMYDLCLEQGLGWDYWGGTPWYIHFDEDDVCLNTISIISSRSNQCDNLTMNSVSYSRFSVGSTILSISSSASRLRPSAISSESISMSSHNMMPDQIYGLGYNSTSLTFRSPGEEA